jgi:uncharacterized protein YfaA (DUF2138 family)
VHFNSYPSVVKNVTDLVLYVYGLSWVSELSKKNVQVILWNSAGNKQRYCMTSYQRGGAEFGKILPCLIYIITSVRQSPILVRI